jgi:DNA-directed RNA polymerase subunit RPC12/RpoP
MSATIFDELETDIGIPCYGYRRCTRQATYIVHIHAINDCRTDTNVNGDVIFFMCPACTAACAWRMGQIIGEMYAQIPDEIEADAEIACRTCGRRILEVHDIFSVERIADGRMHTM